MKLGLFIMFLAYFFSPHTLLGQKCPLFYEKGTVYNDLGNGQTAVCFKRESLVDVDPDVYHTKYTFANSDGKEIYNVHFYFTKQLGNMSIVYFNTVTGKTIDKTIIYGEQNSIRMFKNYKLNDTSINLESRFCTLFTIPEIDRPYVTLNQFQLLDDEHTYLSVSPVKQDKLEIYLSEVALYNKYIDSLNVALEAERVRAAQHKVAISNMLSEMKEYKGNVIKKISEEDEAFKKSDSFLEADSELLETFKNIIKPLFKDYYSNIFPFNDSASVMSFTFFLDADGNINPSKTDIHAINSYKLNWFEDSFKLYIEPKINEKKFKTMLIPRYNSSLITEFDNKFIIPFNKLNPDNDEFKKFIEIKKDIYSEFEKYLVRSMNAPTKYTYVVSYKSTILSSDWIYEVNRKGVEKIGPTDQKAGIPENLKSIFKKNIARPKVGKYHVQICSIYVDNNLVGQDIKEIK